MANPRKLPELHVSGKDVEQLAKSTNQVISTIVNTMNVFFRGFLQTIRVTDSSRGAASDFEPGTQAWSDTDGQPLWSNGTNWVFANGADLKTKLFSGTTDADSQTVIAHGLTSTKIVGAMSGIERSDGVIMLNDIGSTVWGAADVHRVYADGTNIYLDNVGTALRSRPYRVVIFYVK